MSISIVEDHVFVPPPPGVSSWDVDPYSPEVLKNPAPFYEGLRERGPFTYLTKYAMLACGGYDETKEVFSDWKRFVSSRGVGVTDFNHGKHWRPKSIVLEADPPDHTKARTAIARALSPRAAAELKTLFDAEADRLIDRLLERETFDGVADLGQVFVLSVFPKAVGLRDVNRHALLNYGLMGLDLMGPDNESRRASLAMAPEIIPWINQQCSRDSLLPNSLGASIFASADAGDITEDEAGLLVRSMLGAGLDTTLSGIGNTLWCLASHPAEFDRLKNDPSLVRPAFEEALRFTSPVHSFCRTANADTTVGGVNIAMDTKILCVLGAANLDPKQWPEPTRFDIARRPVGHLAFGTGVHGCVGQNLARAEAEAVFTAMAKKVASVELVGEPVWRPNNALRSLSRLPLRIVAR